MKKVLIVLAILAVLVIGSVIGLVAFGLSQINTIAKESITPLENSSSSSPMLLRSACACFARKPLSSSFVSAMDRALGR